MSVPPVAEVLSKLHDGSGRFIGSAPVTWRCAICQAVIFPYEVHQHGESSRDQPS